MIVSVWNQLDAIAERVREAETVFLFTDFDGTLVPIQDKPQFCYLPSHVSELIVQLSRSQRTRIGIVTGRQLSDIRSRIGLDHIAYAGNHGLEIAAPGWVFCEPTAAMSAPRLAHITARLESSLAEIPGVWVQNKHLSASVHYRQANPPTIPRVCEIVSETIRDTNAILYYHIRHGKMTQEIRPIVDWHKGNAISILSQRWSQPSHRSLIIYLGDDETDEDAFRVLPDAITIHVGDSQTTTAKYCVSTPAEVVRFLEWLSKNL